MEERRFDGDDPMQPLQDDERNEDLIGLSEEEYRALRMEQERAEKEAEEQCQKMLFEAERLLKKGDFRSAETFFLQANTCRPDNARAKEGIWLCRTQNFRETDSLYLRQNAEELSVADEKTRAFVLRGVGDRLREERTRLEEQAEPLRARVESAQEVRRKSFIANRNYYLIRFCVFLGVALLCVIGCAVSGYFIPRTKGTAPVALTISFGAIAVIVVLIWIYFARKFLVAQRLLRENEKLSSTEEGARLKQILDALTCLRLVLDGKDEENA